VLPSKAKLLQTLLEDQLPASPQGLGFHCSVPPLKMTYELQSAGQERLEEKRRASGLMAHGKNGQKKTGERKAGCNIWSAHTEHQRGT